MKHQLELIPHEVNNVAIPQRSSDGYINATALCKAAGKEWSAYRRLDSTNEFIDALADDLQKSRTELIQSLSGGVVQGTWVHPQIAVHLGQWLSPKFAVRVSKWVHDWMSGNGTPAPSAALPVHLERYLANDSRVPFGYFSILQEMGTGLYGPMHGLGFDIPESWVPDISVGKLFCKHLRDDHGVDTAALPTYQHSYLDGRKPVPANLYPDELLPIYRRWFVEVWLKEHGHRYFKSKDPAALIYLDKHPAFTLPTPMRHAALPWRSR